MNLLTIRGALVTAAAGNTILVVCPNLVAAQEDFRTTRDTAGELGMGVPHAWNSNARPALQIGPGPHPMWIGGGYLAERQRHMLRDLRGTVEADRALIDWFESRSWGVYLFEFACSKQGRWYGEEVALGRTTDKYFIEFARLAGLI